MREIRLLRDEVHALERRLSPPAESGQPAERSRG